jgi:hypothetical protein
MGNIIPLVKRKIDLGVGVVMIDTVIFAFVGYWPGSTLVIINKGKTGRLVKSKRKLGSKKRKANY